MTPRLTLCSASNETYVMGLAVAVCSTLENLSTEVVAPMLYVLDGGIRERSWQKLEATVRRARPDCVLVRLRPNMGTFAGLPHDWGSSVMAYARLALPAMVPETRVLYFDADLIVQGNINELWDLDLKDAVVAASVDIIAKNLESSKLPTKELGLREMEPCLNSGVLLMDLERWRSEEVTSKAMSYLRMWPNHASNWDQSALNVVLYERWQRIESTWNTPAWWADAGIEGCNHGARVIHFVGPHKPWIFGYHKNASAQIFFQWLDRTPWKGWRPSQMRQLAKWLKYQLWKLRTHALHDSRSKKE